MSKAKFYSFGNAYNVNLRLIEAEKNGKSQVTLR